MLAVGALLLPALAAAVDVQIASFIDNPDPAPRGGEITYTITAQNSDADTANDVVVTFALPSDTVFVSVADAAVPGACVHDGGSPGVITCSYASLLGTLAAPAGPVRTITAVLRTTAATGLTQNASVSISTTSADTNLANNSLSQNTTIDDGADLSAVLVGAPDPATGGGNVTWTVSGSNLGPNASGAVTFTTTLPGVLSYVSGSGTGWACSAAGQVVTCTHAAFAVGAYPSLGITTRITGVSGGTITLNGNMSSTVADPGGSNHTPVASVSVDPGTDLTVTQDAPTPNPAASGGTATFVLHPSNLGPYPASAGATVSFPLPAGFSVNSATGSAGWACSSAGAPVTVSCTFGGSLASGASGTLTIVTTVPTVAGSTTYSNITASIAPNVGGPVDPVAANNTAARNLNVLPDGVDLSISKSKSPNPVALGAPITSSIVVTNVGPQTAAAGSITVTDTLDPAREQYVSASGTNWGCSYNAPVVTCTYNAALDLASTPTLGITTTALAAGTATNNAHVGYSGVPGDYNAANDDTSASVVVTAAANSPDLVVGVSASTAGGVANRVEFNETQVTYTATLSNKVIADAANAQDVVYTLSIPGRRTTTVVTVTGQVLTNTSGNSTASFTCSGTGAGSTGGVTCTQVGGTLLYPGDVVTFTVTADRPLNDGSFNATATAFSTSQGDPQRTDNSATTPVNIDPIADIELVSKLLGANPVLAGTNAVYTITLRNNGPSAAAGVSMTDVFTIPGGDSGFTFLSAVASNSGACVGLTANQSYPSGTPTLSCTWAAAVASGDTRTVTMTIRPNWQAGAAARTLDNTATADTTTPEDSVDGEGTAPNAKSLTLNISPAQVDVQIENHDVPDPLGYDPLSPANNDITYEVVSTNNGPSLATGSGFTYTMTPPAGKTITFRGDSANANAATTTPAGTIAGSLCDQVGSSVTGPATLTLNCVHPAPAELADNAIVRRYLVFRVETAPNIGGDTYNTNATVVVNETETNTANNSEAEGTTVRVRSDLSVTKTPSANPVQLRQPFDWSIVVSNAGPGDSQATGLTDTLPADMVFGAATPTWVSSNGGSGNCSVVGQVLTCAFGLVPAGHTATVTIPGARMTSYPGGGTTQNCASATTSEVDPNSVDNLTVCSNLTVQRSSLAGTVFEDRDRVGANAGTPQAAVTEPRIAGVTITLTGTDAYGNAVSRTATTDAAGAYSFGDLSPAGAGGYTLTQTQPASYANGPADPPVPAVGGTFARGGNTGNSMWSTIALTPNTAGTAYDFPEVRQPSLAGFVYIDVNRNGVRDAGTDTPIPAATVRLLHATTLAEIAVTSTLADGSYQFANLDPLVPYTLEEPLPAAPVGLANGPVNPGLIGGAACAAGCTAQASGTSTGADRIAAIDLSSGANGTQFNFGEVSGSAITGRIWLDANRNGVLDGSEPIRLAGVVVNLYQGAACSGPVYATSTTDVNGAYGFGAAPGLNYTVCEVQPAGYGDGAVVPGNAAAISGGNAITVTNLPAGGSANNNFGETLGSLTGAVYLDANNDGLRQGAETGFAGVTITLTGTDAAGGNVSLSTTTDANGNYRFDNLLGAGPAGYTVTEPTQPTNSGNGITTPGSTGGTATLVAVVPSAISAIVLPAGADSLANNFGEVNDSPDLRVSKRHVQARFTVGLRGTYEISVRNAGPTASSGSYTVSDRLPEGLTLAATPSGSGWTCSGAAGAGSVSCTNSTGIAAGATLPSVITAFVNVAASAQPHSPVDNAVMVDGGGESESRRPSAAERDAFLNNPATLPECTPAIEHNVCRTPTPVQLAASLSGTAWLDLGGSSRLLDGGDRRLPGWTVEVIDPATGAIVGSEVTAADGTYFVGNLEPGVPLVVRFRDPVSGVVFGYPVNGETAPGSSGATCDATAAVQGKASSCVGEGVPQLGVVLAPGQNLPQQSLPVDPSGVVYDSTTRQPIPGSVVTLSPVGSCSGWNPATGLVGATLGGYTIDGGSVSMTVGADGLYQFLFGPNAPARCTFGLTVTPPAGSDYVASVLIRRRSGRWFRPVAWAAPTRCSRSRPRPPGPWARPPPITWTWSAARRAPTSSTTTFRWTHRCPRPST